MSPNKSWHLETYSTLKSSKSSKNKTGVLWKQPHKHHILVFTERCCHGGCLEGHFHPVVLSGHPRQPLTSRLIQAINIPILLPPANPTEGQEGVSAPSPVWMSSPYNLNFPPSAFPSFWVPSCSVQFSAQMCTSQIENVLLPAIAKILHSTMCFSSCHWQVNLKNLFSHHLYSDECAMEKSVWPKADRVKLASTQ